MESIRKWVNIDVLPKWENTENMGKIKWLDCIGKEVNFEYNELKGVIKILNYESNTEKLTVQYLDDSPKKIISTNFKDGLLGNIVPKEYVSRKINDYMVGNIVKTKNNGKLLILSAERLFRKGRGTTERAYKYRCLKCGNEEITYITNLSKGVGCPVCNGNKVLKGYNDIATKRPDLVRYFCDIENAYRYGINSHIKLWFKCPDCGAKRKIQAKLFIKRKFNCPMCDKTYSIPNKIAYNMLLQLNIEFEAERLFSWCRYKKFNSDKSTKGLFDFYFIIDNHEYILEMDGGHHKIGRQGLSAEEQQYIDKTKDKLAKEHNIEVIRIDCFKSDLKYIKENIYKSRLKDILDLDKVNWNECSEKISK